jgi:transcriptional regulator with XRE-family HTH domain
VNKVLLDEASRLQERAGLSDDDVARATGAAQSTARAWLNGSRSPTGERAERLIELSALVERLERLIEPGYISVWLRKPVPALDDDKPLDLIGRGEYRRVARLISELEGTTAT